MKFEIGDLVKFREGYRWQSVGLVIAIQQDVVVDMYKILWASPADPDYPEGWHHLTHLEVLNEV